MSDALELAEVQVKWATLEVEFQKAKDARRSSPEANAIWDEVKHRYADERDFWRGLSQAAAAPEGTVVAETVSADITAQGG